ncbi:UNVERIFIED_CONTAM: hypothetical protein FKN15_045644 [Acipenser sinensis]
MSRKSIGQTIKDSDWDNESDESDTKTNDYSQQNSELQQSFLCNNDPYNSLGFSIVSGMGQDPKKEKRKTGPKTADINMDIEERKREDKQKKNLHLMKLEVEYLGNRWQEIACAFEEE